MLAIIGDCHNVSNNNFAFLILSRFGGIRVGPMFCSKCTLSISVHCAFLVLRSGLSSIIFQATLETTANVDIQPEKYKVGFCKFNFKTNSFPTKSFLKPPLLHQVPISHSCGN